MFSEELLKFLLLMPFLLLMSYNDMKTMTVSNKLIKILFVFVVLVTIMLNYKDPMIMLSTAIYTILIFLIMIVMFSFGMLGGADGKLLAVISILFPNFIALRNIFPFQVFEMIVNLSPKAAAILSIEIPFVLILYINATFISGITFAFMLRKHSVKEITKNFGSVKVPFIPFITAGFVITFLFVNKALIFGA
jgi:prepilin signal peptidase PulO-like enzyme (type II secretory pathway)